MEKFSDEQIHNMVDNSRKQMQLNPLLLLCRSEGLMAVRTAAGVQVANVLEEVADPIQEMLKWVLRKPAEDLQDKLLRRSHVTGRAQDVLDVIRALAKPGTVDPVIVKRVVELLDDESADQKVREDQKILGLFAFTYVASGLRRYMPIIGPLEKMPRKSDTKWLFASGSSKMTQHR